MTLNLARKLIWATALLTLLCLPALAEEDAISKGIDVWATPGNGHTFSNFALEPIPAGFFCEGSEPFTGKIVFRGVPVNTSPHGALGDADTVIERLDDAAFDQAGLAYTRVRFAALQLEAVEPVETDCGFFSVTVSLAGEQPITSMRITRLDKDGGMMETILAGEVHLTFTPIDRDDLEPRVLGQSFRFAPARGAWGLSQRVGFRQDEGIALDSDGDGEVDREVPGLSNFAAGGDRASGAFLRRDQLEPVIHFPQPSDCHCTPTAAGFSGPILELGSPDSRTGCLHLHCPGPVLSIQPDSTTPDKGRK